MFSSAPSIPFSLGRSNEYSAVELLVYIITRRNNRFNYKPPQFSLFKGLGVVSSDSSEGESFEAYEATRPALWWLRPVVLKAILRFHIISEAFSSRWPAFLFLFLLFRERSLRLCRGLESCATEDDMSSWGQLLPIPVLLNSTLWQQNISGRRKKMSTSTVVIITSDCKLHHTLDFLGWSETRYTLYYFIKRRTVT